MTKESWYDKLPTFPPGVSLSYTGACGGDGADPPVLELYSWRCMSGDCIAHLVQRICGDPTETEYEIRQPLHVGHGYMAMMPTSCSCGAPMEYGVRELAPPIPAVFTEAFADG